MDLTGSGTGALISAILSGGSNAIIALMLLILIGNILIIRYLYKEVKQKDEDLKKGNERYLELLDTYHDSSKEVADALTVLRLALIEIKSKI